MSFRYKFFYVFFINDSFNSFINLGFWLGRCVVNGVIFGLLGILRMIFYIKDKSFSCFNFRFIPGCLDLFI